MLKAVQRLRGGALTARSLRNRSRKGVTAVEFAMIAPVLFLMLIGIVETSLMLLAQHIIENATYNASRLSKTGYRDTGKTQIETVMDVLNRELGSLNPLINVARLSFNSTVYGTLTQIDHEEDGNGLGTAEQIVVFTISYPWQVFTPMMGSIIGDENGIVNLSSRIVVKNEPYT
jgi:hypothetical protein